MTTSPRASALRAMLARFGSYRTASQSSPPTTTVVIGTIRSASRPAKPSAAPSMFQCTAKTASAGSVMKAATVKKAVAAKATVLTARTSGLNSMCA